MKRDSSSSAASNRTTRGCRRRAVCLAAAVLIVAQGAAGCRRAHVPDALFDLTVRPPADNEERLETLPFTITAGATAMRDLVALCTIERITTNTMTIADNTELMGNIDRLDPRASRTVHCDPQVYLDPGRIDVQQATVTLALEFVADGIAGRQSAAFTYDAVRDVGEGLRWHLTHVTSSRNGSRDAKP